MRNNKAYTAKERRAANMVWTAAGDYSFDPVFLAFQQNGAPDLYMNSIIGYTRRQYDPAVIDGLFALFAGTVREELYDGLCWLALEQAVFEREQQERPVLTDLRKAAAEAFFAQEREKSRQQWMSQNSRLYAQQAARWHMVLGQTPHFLNPRDRALAKALQLSGNLSAEALRDRILACFAEYLHFHPDKKQRERSIHLQGALAALLVRLFPARLEHQQLLRLRLGSGGEDSGSNGRQQAKLASGSLKRAGDGETEAYLAHCFGRPLLQVQDMTALRQKLCRGRHLCCSLYLTDGNREAAGSNQRFQKLEQDAQRQRRENEAFYKAQAARFLNSSRRLTAALKNEMLLAESAAPLRGESGRLCPSLIWRAQYLSDAAVFLRSGEDVLPQISVDLLLDASASRLRIQPLLTAQARIIAEGLQHCGIPVQVSSFLSLRGYTVLRRFCTYGETDKNDRIFDYFAAGWNRDGLAISAAGELMKSSPAERKLLLVLTDASPNDDTPIPADPAEGRPVSRSYAGAPAVEDTALSVAALRKNGIQVVGILTGSAGGEAEATRIYGSDFIRIRDISQLADSVGSILLRHISSLGA